MKNKEKIPLIIALSIPVVMVLLLAASIYLPAFGVHPKTNFLYCYGDQYSCSKYSLKANKISEQEVVIYPEYYRPHKQPKFFIYDVTTGTSTEVSYEQAGELVLNGDMKSPDGFEVVSDTSGGYSVFPLFYSYSNYGQKYLKKGNYSKKLEINPRDGAELYNYNNGFNFIGWVMKGE